MSALVEKQWNTDPETGYEFLAEVQWGEACYDFDLTRIWLRTADGTLWMADDSGCSCPSPFESTTVSELKPIKRLQDWYDHVKDHYAHDHPASVDECETARKAIEAHLAKALQ